MAASFGVDVSCIAIEGFKPVRQFYLELLSCGNILQLLPVKLQSIEMFLFCGFQVADKQDADNLVVSVFASKSDVAV